MRGVKEKMEIHKFYLINFIDRLRVLGILKFILHKEFELRD
jgi:hypothetical protein